MTNSTRIRPAKRLMNAAGGCAKYGAEYGNCILLKYQTIKKGDCAQEFQKFKSCVTEKMAKK